MTLSLSPANPVVVKSQNLFFNERMTELQGYWLRKIYNLVQFITLSTACLQLLSSMRRVLINLGLTFQANFTPCTYTMHKVLNHIPMLWNYDSSRLAQACCLARAKQHGNQSLKKKWKEAVFIDFHLGYINKVTQHFHRINQSRHTKRQAPIFHIQTEIGRASCRERVWYWV